MNEWIDMPQTESSCDDQNHNYEEILQFQRYDNNESFD